MTGRNPRYPAKHPPRLPHKPVTVPPGLRAREPLEQPGPLAYKARIAHYTAANATRRLTGPQQRRLDAKAHRASSQPARAAAATRRREEDAAWRQQLRDAVLLGRVTARLPIRWATSRRADEAAGG